MNAKYFQKTQPNHSKSIWDAAFPVFFASIKLVSRNKPYMHRVFQNVEDSLWAGYRLVPAFTTANRRTWTGRAHAHNAGENEDLPNATS